MSSDTIARYIRLFALCATVLTLTFVFNIAAHEIGHYAIADHYNLNPSIHVGRGTNDAQTNFDLVSTLTSPSIYTAYSAESKDLTSHDAIIAFFGPFVNLMIAMSALVMYKKLPKHKKGDYGFLIFLLIFLPSLASGVINLLPFANSDGRMIFDYLISVV